MIENLEEICTELGKLEKDVLVMMIVSGKLLDDLQNISVSDYLKKNPKFFLNTSKQSIEDISDYDESTMAIDDREDSVYEDDSCDLGCFMDKSNESNEQIQGVHWRDYVPGKIPMDVVESIDGKYIGQVRYENKLLPACIFPDNHVAVAERYGKKVIKDNIKILCCEYPHKFYWEEANFDDPPCNQLRNVFVGGYQDGYNLYIGKTCLEGEWKIGKVVPHAMNPYKGLQIWNKNDEFVMRKQFHILKYQPVTTFNEDITRQDFFWRNYILNEAPKDALEAILDKQIYIGQVHHYENLLPVAIYLQENIAIGERAGKVEFYEDIQILCAPDLKKFYWEKVDFRNPSTDIMKNAVKGGYQDGYNLYVGRANHKGKWKVGKVVPMSNNLYKGLQVWGDYNECVIITEFEMLKCYTNNLPRPEISYKAQGCIKYMSKKKKVSILPRCRSFLRVFFKQLTPPCCSAPKHYRSNLLYCNSKQGFYWRDYNLDDIPQDAIKGGGGTYIGQVNYEGHILPACIYPLKGLAVAERYGKRVFMENIKILCCPNPERFTWDYVNFNRQRSSKQLNDVFIGGHQDGYNLYIGKILLNGEWNIGKVVPHIVSSYKGLQVIDKNSEFKMYRKFHLLKYNPIFMSHKNKDISKV